ALVSKPYRFSARAWEMNAVPLVSPHDPVGTNLFGHVLRGRLMRVVPREYEAINETWIADRDRFSYEGIYSPDRLTTALLRRGARLAPGHRREPAARGADPRAPPAQGGTPRRAGGDAEPGALPASVSGPGTTHLRAGGSRRRPRRGPRCRGRRDRQERAAAARLCSGRGARDGCAPRR